ncbi:MAG: hypothetical protein H0U79_05595 [Solirubrobacterales bacterium]|nr:hypothetical protein [Solirubrobacterales bacterium]
MSTALTPPMTPTEQPPPGVPAPGFMANLPNSERPEVQVGTAFAAGLLAALLLKRLVG